MPVHVDEVTTEVVPEGTSASGAEGGPGDVGAPAETDWKRVARLRAARRRLRETAARTRAEGFDD